MKVQELHIQNFRGIADLELQNADPAMNIVVGVNGVGKTSFLDAMAISFSWMIARMKSGSARGNLPTESDITHGAKGACAISVTLDNGVSWTVGKTKTSYARTSPFKSDLAALTTLTDDIVRHAEEGGCVPVLMYYPVERSVAAAPVNLHKVVPSIWDIYTNALTGNSNFRAMFEWYRRQEDIENEMIRDHAGYRDPSLEAIRKAIGIFFPDFSELRIRRHPRQSMVIKKGKEEIEFTQLSQGEKCYLALICDIARRLAMANPAQPSPLEGEGIVLIDEIDLHLHPKWQSEVVSKLMKVFPNCQFFLSTHSPLVLSDAKRNQILPLDNGKLACVSYDAYGKLASSIMTNYFDVPYQRNQGIALKIREAFCAIREGDKKRYDALFAELREVLDMSDPDMANLVVEANRRSMV